ncbi:hypothetical protein [Jeotgalicoccus psychrophilus]|uniref:hypothetical protein n=1 Tax=Jeotgalicoccus psychrophilus TaxID=157228 RepID=UPI0004797FBC|nr:hypothetical protein [Jeotgalicoccus psychrophilus]
MEITVKRRTWLLGIFMPVSLEFNGKTVASLYVYQEKTVPITAETGRLKYTQPLDRSHQIQVKDGDTVTLKETKLGLISNIIFMITVIYYIVMGQEIFESGFLNNINTVSVIAFILLLILVILGVLTLFFNQYKFVIEN